MSMLPSFHLPHLGEGFHWPHHPQGQLAPRPMVELDVECTVCHVVGVIEVPMDEQPRIYESWDLMPCAFTEGCIGHVWPEAAN